MQELITAIHMHTRFSDGSGLHQDLANAGLEAGVDALLVSDHNVLAQGLEGYYQKGRQRLLMLVGEELHDPTLKEKGSHLLVLGNQELSANARTAKLIDQANAAGALSFIAHPIEEPLRIFGGRIRLAIGRSKLHRH